VTPLGFDLFTACTVELCLLSKQAIGLPAYPFKTLVTPDLCSTRIMLHFACTVGSGSWLGVYGLLWLNTLSMTMFTFLFGNTIREL